MSTKGYDEVGSVASKYLGGSNPIDTPEIGSVAGKYLREAMETPPMPMDATSNQIQPAAPGSLSPDRNSQVYWPNFDGSTKLPDYLPSEGDGGLPRTDPMPYDMIATGGPDILNNLMWGAKDMAADVANSIGETTEEIKGMIPNYDPYNPDPRWDDMNTLQKIGSQALYSGFNTAVGVPAFLATLPNTVMNQPLGDAAEELGGGMVDMVGNVPQQLLKSITGLDLPDWAMSPERKEAAMRSFYESGGSDAFYGMMMAAGPIKAVAKRGKPPTVAENLRAAQKRKIEIENQKKQNVPERMARQPINPLGDLRTRELDIKNSGIEPKGGSVLMEPGRATPKQIAKQHGLAFNGMREMPNNKPPIYTFTMDNGQGTTFMVKDLKDVPAKIKEKQAAFETTLKKPESKTTSYMKTGAKITGAGAVTAAIYKASQEEDGVLKAVGVPAMLFAATKFSGNKKANPKFGLKNIEKGIQVVKDGVKVNEPFTTGYTFHPKKNFGKWRETGYPVAIGGISKIKLSELTPDKIAEVAYKHKDILKKHPKASVGLFDMGDGYVSVDFNLFFPRNKIGLAQAKAVGKSFNQQGRR